jgi:hypothetical protein
MTHPSRFRPRARGLALAACLAASLLPAAATAAEPVLSKIEVFPPDIKLTGARDRQLVVVQATYADGITRDVTKEATIEPANPALVRRVGNVFWPAADGATELTVAFGGQTLKAPVTVTQAADTPPLSFRLDIMPVFMRAGCNTGSCHGAARGKDGFRLSLFGFDPEGDHYRLTRELSGRRINLAMPDDSTLLDKALGSVQHTGGKLMEKDSELYQALRSWIAAGATNDDVSKLPKVTGVDISPKGAVLDGEGATQQYTVRATYSDGSDRDVTGLAVFLSNNDNSAKVDKDGLVTAAQRGEAFIMARFETFTVGSQVLVLPKGLQFEYPSEANYIDTLVAAKLRKLRIAPSEVCTDEEFLRRATIDIAGVVPTVEEFVAFTTSTAPDKRAKLVEELLGRKEFAEIWVNKWAEMLQVRTVPNQVSQKGMFLYYNWLVEKLQNNTPMDEMVRDILGASGGTFRSPATNFYQGTLDRQLLTENVAQVFMGMRIQCAQCHNHPFDRWTMDDYYSFAAFFSQIGRKQGEDYRETIVFNAGGGEQNHPVGGRVMKPKFLGDAEPEIKPGEDRRVVMAKWLASKENPFFAKSFVNRVWAHFQGIGIVEPVDDFRVSNPATNPELLDALAKRFTDTNFDLKALVRDITASRTYQRSTLRNESNKLDEKNFAHANLRRIKAENLLDIISEVTETKDKFPGLPLGARAVQIANGVTSTYFLTTFGRATRETVCSCEVKMEPTLSQALHLLNGDTTNAKIAQGGVIKKLMETKKFPEERIEDLYIRTLGRKPLKAELDRLLPAFAPGANAEQALTDLFWALLNSREFLFNH